VTSSSKGVRSIKEDRMFSKHLSICIAVSFAGLISTLLMLTACVPVPGQPITATDGVTVASAPAVVTKQSDAGSLHLSWIWPAGDLRVVPVVAAGADGTIYAIDSEGTLHALTPSGKELWTYHGEYERATAPVISRETQVLYFLGDNDVLYAIGTDGVQRWKRKSSLQPVWAPLAAPDGTVYLSGKEGAVRVSPDGQSEVPFTWPAPLSPLLAVFDNAERLFAPGQDSLSIFSPQGQKLASCPYENAFTQPVALPEGGLVYPDMAGNLVALDSACSVLWRYTPDDAESAGMLSHVAVASDGTVAAASNLGDLVALDAKGTLRWKADIPGEMSLLSGVAFGPGGMVVVTTWEGDLFAFDRKGNLAWSRSPYFLGMPGRPLPSDIGLALVHGGRLHYFTIDPSMAVAEPTPLPPPISRAAAEEEIAASMLEEFGCGARDGLLVWGSTENPLKVWRCQDNRWELQQDIQAAIAEAEKANEASDPIAESFPVARYDFNILSVSDNYLEAEAETGAQYGLLWGSGYRVKLHRLPGGLWRIIEREQTWVS
jgi:outer membrane protein assembly factor BamB